ncbi:MAG: MCE family protein [Candidatus Electrothrix sp. AR3]|nr:MCE family protein [Candidatus Electrothrix sp. AR3]
MGGGVINISLNTDQGIQADVLIYEEYTALINGSTRFYTLSGVSFNASLQGIALQTESLTTIVAGGISFFTPQKDKPLLPEQVLPLYANQTEALQADALFLTLELKNANGINEQTKIKYKGIVIGSLSKLRYAPEKNRVISQAVVQKDMRRFFRTTTELRLVRPRIDLAGVRNLNTLLSGVYIDLHPGKGKQIKHFSVTDSAPIAKSRSGKRFTLKAIDSGSLRLGAPVLFRKQEVGEVTAVGLSSKGQEVELEILLYDYYLSLINRSTRFYKATGISLSASLQGISLESESLQSIATGGISFITPHDDKPLKEGAVLPLYANQKKALQADSLFIDLEFSNGHGINPQTKIKYKGIIIGTVTEIHYDQEKDKAVAKAAVDKALAKFFSANNRSLACAAQSRAFRDQASGYHADRNLYHPLARTGQKTDSFRGCRYRAQSFRGTAGLKSHFRGSTHRFPEKGQPCLLSSSQGRPSDGARTWPNSSKRLDSSCCFPKISSNSSLLFPFLERWWGQGDCRALFRYLR